MLNCRMFFLRHTPRSPLHVYLGPFTSAAWTLVAASVAAFAAVLFVLAVLPNLKTAAKTDWVSTALVRSSITPYFTYIGKRIPFAEPESYSSRAALFAVSLTGFVVLHLYKCVI